MNSASKKLYQSWLILRITYGTLFILVGADKFFNLLTNWQQFIGATTNHFLPIDPSLLLKLFGVIQIFAGLLLFTRWIRFGIYLILALLLIIFINLFSAPTSLLVIGHDLGMIAGIIVLWNLTEIVKN
jgi:uncharacterized membrane protein YphA (DoxX/SURF4 family)